MHNHPLYYFTINNEYQGIDGYNCIASGIKLKVVVVVDFGILI